MRIFNAFTTALLMLLITSCSNNVDISSDYNKQFDFSGLKTYNWHKPNEYNEASKTYLNNDILDQRIRNNVDEHMQKAGIQLVKDGDVDFWVNYTVSSEPRMDVNTYNTYSGYAPGWGVGGYYGTGPYRYSGVGMSYGVSGTETSVTHYQQGTLVIDVVDPASGQLVWRGTAEGKIPKNLSQQEKEQAVKEVVAEVLASFPPK